MLESKGVVLFSQIIYAHMRDESGGLTEFKNWDRFLYCEPLPNSIPLQLKVCGFYFSVYHHGRDNACVCKLCAQVGHKSGDSEYPACVEDGIILAFSELSSPSKITFMAMCLTVPDGIIKQLDQRILRYSQREHDRIQRSVINRLEEGGLNMLNLQTQICAINAAWTSR